jgi:CheY-like chemotaxis protein
MASEKQDKRQSILKRQQFWLDLGIIVGINAIAVLAGIIGISVQRMGQPGAALVCGGAFFAVGVLIGFLFGIPRVLQKETAPATPPSGSAPAGPGGKGPEGPAQASPALGAAAQPAAPASGYRIEVNTNLEQISDWLTKIIVGLGLVELRELPAHLHKLAEFLAFGIKLPLPVAVEASQAARDAAVRSAEVLALMTVVYFTLVGFFGGYLMTRTYLTGAFRRADEDNLDIQIPVGSENNKDMFMLSLNQADELKRWQINDLREQVIGLQEKFNHKTDPEKPDSEGGQKRGTVQVSRILWVDDEPKNNSYVIAYLDSIGVKVINAATTEEALQKLASDGIDCVVTDLNHPDKNKGAEPAGIELVRRIRAQNSKIPIYIFTSRHHAESYKSAAQAAGATQITDSPTQLLAALRR